MPISTTDDGNGRITIHLPRRIDDEFVQRLGSQLRHRARTASMSEVLLDGSAVEHVSTRGLALLLSLQRLARVSTREVRIVHPSAHLEHSIRRGGLSRRLRLPTASVALAAAADAS